MRAESVNRWLQFLGFKTWLSFPEGSRSPVRSHFDLYSSSQLKPFTVPTPIPAFTLSVPPVTHHLHPLASPSYLAPPPARF